MSALTSQLATKQDIVAFSGDIKLSAVTVKRWMFILWLAQIAATLAIVILLSGK